MHLTFILPLSPLDCNSHWSDWPFWLDLIPILIGFGAPSADRLLYDHNFGQLRIFNDWKQANLFQLLTKFFGQKFLWSGFFFCKTQFCPILFLSCFVCFSEHWWCYLFYWLLLWRVQITLYCRLPKLKLVLKSQYTLAEWYKYSVLDCVRTVHLLCCDNNCQYRICQQ